MRGLDEDGKAAAEQTIKLMRRTFGRVPPSEILSTFVTLKGKPHIGAKMWEVFGEDTIGVMQDGTHLLAVLWESAWVAGGGEDVARDTSALEEQQAMDICAPQTFLRSFSVSEIGKALSDPGIA